MPTEPPRASPRELRTELARVRRDREHGAASLLRTALAALEREVATWQEQSATELRRRAGGVAAGLAKTQPAMGTFRRWSAEWRRIARGTTADQIVQTGQSWVLRWKRNLRQEPALLARTVRRRLPPGAKIVTFSRSSTVTGALGALPPARRPKVVWALESRPGGEGRDLARDLRRAGIRARMVPDRSLWRVIRSSDLVLIGADAVLPDRSVVHKVGTRTLAKEARRAGVPVIVLAGRSKWVRLPPSRARLPPRFDRTPAALITEFWTDLGVAGRRRRGPPTRG
jgi:translation initiation factor 2B subunit (eIF-2B alpha/beta/delta family)